MSIFNWRKKKEEEQKKQVTQQKKEPAVISVASSPAAAKSNNKEIEKVEDSKHAPETARSTGDAHRVLLRPLITEKNTLHQTQNQYVFEVSRRVNKVEVQKAVENAFKVKVIKVRIVSMRGKVKQFGRIKGVRKFWKKAIVTIGKGDQITLLSSV